MIRMFIGSILGLGAAVALLGPDVVTGPRGEPMLVAAPGAATLHEASFDGSACPAPLLLHDEKLLSETAKTAAGAHVVTIAFHYGPDGVSMTMEDGATDAEAGLVLVFDDEGRIVAVTYPPSTRERMLADAFAADCMAGPTVAPSGV